MFDFKKSHSRTPDTVGDVAKRAHWEKKQAWAHKRYKGNGTRFTQMLCVMPRHNSNQTY